MYTHIFANIMLTAYDITVLNKERIEKTNTKERKSKNKKYKTLNLANQRKIENFSLHQDFFAKTGNLKTQEYGDDNINTKETYQKLINIIDSKAVFTQTERQMFFYKYEQLYNALIAQYVVSNLEKKEILRKYTKATIPAIVALDMYKTLSLSVDKEQLHFYSHIHHFILSEYYDNHHNNLESLCKGVRAYLKYYIKTLAFNPIVNLFEITTSINNIRTSSFTTICNIDTIIDACKKEASEIGKPHDTQFEQLRVAYTSLSVLLAFQKITHLLTPLVSNYKKLLEDKLEAPDPLFYLERYLYQNVKNDPIFLGEDALYEYIEVLISHEKIDIPSCEDDCDCGQGPECECQCIPSYCYGILNILENFIFENKSHLPLPTLVPSINLSEFSLKKISIFELSSYLDELCDEVPSLKLYKEIPYILELLYANELDNIREVINEISFEEFPLGFFTSTLAIINLALKIKFEPKSIRYGSLLSYINPILTNQGVYTEYIIVTPDIKNSTQSVSDIEENPVINDPNNQTVLHSIMIYNRMIKKMIIYDNDHSELIAPQSVYGLLDSVELALKKLREAFFQEKMLLTDKELASLIIQNKVLTKHETNDNLIGILNEATLYNCLGCLSYLYKNLAGYGESLPNILSFTGISKDEHEERETLRRALLIVKEKQTNKDN
ncbi:hypothetical protein [Providencia rettgeri]|uniref:hypothetical protein n=2 Tax=Providencia rettgeri TaxID=587 RepID=UPI001181FBE0|nr:hypothetical protein [Providencia rettgeri]